MIPSGGMWYQINTELERIGRLPNRVILELGWASEAPGGVLKC